MGFRCICYICMWAGELTLFIPSWSHRVIWIWGADEWTPSDSTTYKYPYNAHFYVRDLSSKVVFALKCHEKHWQFVYHRITLYFSKKIFITTTISDHTFVVAFFESRTIKSGCSLMTPICYLLTKIWSETDLVFDDFEIDGAKSIAALL